MTPINCPECGNVFSDSQDCCPQCGYPLELITGRSQDNTNALNKTMKRAEEQKVPHQSSLPEMRGAIETNDCGFLISEFDKFNDKTTTECSVGLSLSINCGVNVDSTFLIRHISIPVGERVAFYLYISMYDWIFIRDGELIFNIDGFRNIKLPAHEIQSDVYRDLDFTGERNVRVMESAWYDVSKDDLKAICDARVLSVQLGARRGRFELDGGEILLYCRLFYNQFYDGNAYGSLVTTYWPKLKRAAKRNQVKESIGNTLGIINMLGNGCSGMVLLLICSSIGILYGIVKIAQIIVA